jgi:3-hydroxybutyryl-CoA dehydrogenase
MSGADLRGSPVLVVGAGIMGAGIAQVAAQAGHCVCLYDAREGAAQQARSKLSTQLQALVDKGRVTAETAATTLANIVPVGTLEAASGVRLVVEAIVEDYEAKGALLRRLEALVSPECVLASNTSSLSITALSNGMAVPGRLVGMHFFNPVPLMKLVEVVSGLHTDHAIAAAIFNLSRAWGKVPVHARSTPGFIVNRIARPFYAETLALLQEQAAPPELLDAAVRAAGFRMGPCELMDLIGHDTNFAVTQSVYAANFFDKRFVPSLVQRELVDGGLLGRKSGRGFYRYPEGAPALPAVSDAAPAPASRLAVHGDHPFSDWIAQVLEAASPRPSRVRNSDWVGLAIDSACLMLTDGRCAGKVASESGTRDIAVFDRPIQMPGSGTAVLTYAVCATASDGWAAQAQAWLARLGFVPHRIADTPGLVVARTIAMLINEAADAVLQGVCTVEAADAAMKLGVNYPAGPFEWLAAWSANEVVAVLDALAEHYRGERYRASPWLRRHAMTIGGRHS